MVLLDDIEEKLCALFPTETGVRMMVWSYSRFGEDLDLLHTRAIYEVISEREKRHARVIEFTESPVP